MGVKQLRLEKGWSQEELSHLSGLSVRTIQRIERGNKAGLESLKSLAAVFELRVSDLQSMDPNLMANSKSESQETVDMNEQTNSDRKTDLSESAEKKAVIAQVKRIKAFNKNLISYAGVILLLLVINLLTNPGYFWVVWPALGWGIALLIQGLSAHEVINIFGSDWEKRQIEKRLEKNQDRS
ncbi:hypothetical protein MED121_22687 [Marinomonas sp. MED121]|uniref:2TM domain-containing protein n=1 Tax=Marinomonas sp. MED121 TaxID=314277 RepID=UPI000068FDDE|nr:2TM domain-containing protein [Marinomonas sp. MED121]EAQ65527.1 hypothetical protein MED121_22687 [Marinomonas sp. MED121]